MLAKEVDEDEDVVGKEETSSHVQILQSDREVEDYCDSISASPENHYVSTNGVSFFRESFLQKKLATFLHFFCFSSNLL